MPGRCEYVRSHSAQRGSGRCIPSRTCSLSGRHGFASSAHRTVRAPAAAPVTPAVAGGCSRGDGAAERARGGVGVLAGTAGLPRNSSRRRRTLAC